MADYPMHGDIWERQRIGAAGRWFSVMHVCGHHTPPHVTGYWHDDKTREGINSCLHEAIPLPVFVRDFALVEREDADAA